MLKLDINDLKNKSILITGVTGVLGLNLNKKLQELNSKFDLNLKLYGVSKNLPTKDQLDFFKVNLTKIILWDMCKESDIVKNLKFDLIFHFAGYGQPNKFINSQIEILTINSLRIFDLWNSLNNNGVFIFSSTSEVYSNCLDFPCDESHKTDQNLNLIRTPYALSKLIGETLLLNLTSAFKNVIILRISLVYGPGFKIDDGRVMIDFIRQGLDGKIQTRGNSNYERTFCHINDFVDACIYLILNKEYGTFNISGTSKTTIANLAFMISKIINCELILSDEELIGEGPRKVSINSNKIWGMMQKTEFIPLSSGIKDMIEWYKKLLGEN